MLTRSQRYRIEGLKKDIEDYIKCSWASIPNVTIEQQQAAVNQLGRILETNDGGLAYDAISRFHSHKYSGLVSYLSKK